MEKPGILRCEMSRQGIFVFVFDHTRLTVVGAMLLLMIILQVRAGMPEERSTKILLAASFFIVACYFAVLLRATLANAKDRTRSVSITPEGDLIVETLHETRTMKYEELLFTMTYTSFNTLSITYIGENKYVTARMSNAYLFLKQEKEPFRNFYAIAAFVKENSPHNEDVVVSRKAKKHPWIRIPKGVLETEFYSKKAERAITVIREEYLSRLK